MNSTHPYIRYGLAVVLENIQSLELEHVESFLSSILDNIKNQDIDKQPQFVNDFLSIVQEELMRGLDYFRLKPLGLVTGKSVVNYSYINRKEKPEKGSGLFLSPQILVNPDFMKKEVSASNTYDKCKEIHDLVSASPKKRTNATLSISPVSGDYLSFSEKNASKVNPGLSALETAFCLITTTTRAKPSLEYRTKKDEGVELTNTAIIPDLPLPELVRFIRLFRRKSYDLKDSLTGKVDLKVDKKTEALKIIKYHRPGIFSGNFPNAPRSSVLSGIALLGGIGTWVKDAEYANWALKTLESLKNAQMYMVSYGKAQAFSYNHYVVELAKQNKLSIIIDSIYHSTLFNEGKRNFEKGNLKKYEAFDLFTARFLMQFNQPAFRDFLAFRAEYPEPVIILLKSYFLNMEKIEPAIVASARVMGKWLNLAAYIAAKNDVNPNMGNPSDWEKLYKQKAKFLVELESSVYGARTSDALAFQAVERAARLSGMDAPEGSAYFLEEICKGEKLSLDQAKHLLIAFSRIRNKTERKETPVEAKTEVDELDEQTDEEEDFENA